MFNGRDGCFFKRLDIKQKWKKQQNKMILTQVADARAFGWPSPVRPPWASIDIPHGATVIVIIVYTKTKKANIS